MSSLSLCLVLAASLGPNDRKSLGVLPVADAPRGGGLPAQFTWADVDGDGRLELGALDGDGKLRLLAPVGGDRFEDATERFGLAGVEDAALVLWRDYDADGRVDLFIGAREGESRLFRNAGGVLEDWSAAAGLALDGAVQSATWLDHDGDGRLDLAAVTAEGNALCLSLFRGQEGGFFARTELTEVAGMPLEVPAGPVLVPEESDHPGAAGDPASRGDQPSMRSPRAAQDPAPTVQIPLGPGGGPASGSAPPFPFGCAYSIGDQADMSVCLQASTTPALGRLYPLSSNLFVAVSGEVGIGTTTPAARLDVAGTARITDTLTLAPTGDQALVINAGSIYKDGALFLHTHGASNTGVGREALLSTTGSWNTASGFEALRNSTTGSFNTASGGQALVNNTTGNFNTASGAFALASNTTGSYNTATGRQTLLFNTTGGVNTATGSLALAQNTTGNNNTATGGAALVSNTTGTFNTATGAAALLSNTTGSYNTSTGRQALFYNTTGGVNTATGSLALAWNTTGNNNTATGGAALLLNTTGNLNTATGASALWSNTTGSYNTATGRQTLASNTTGGVNVASGSLALTNNTTGGGNTACGGAALASNTTGYRNVALGFYAGADLTTGNDNIDIGNRGVAGESQTIRIGTAGTHTRTFLAGVHGATTDVADGIPVVVDSNGQLGTISSSQRFKEEIRDMGDASERLLALRPVTFRYKPEVQAGERPLEYGLIAEEVAEVFPDLVVYDEEGKPFTVKYHLLSAMLLNELQHLNDAHGQELAELRERLAALEGEVQEATRTAAAGGAAVR